MSLGGVDGKGGVVVARVGGGDRLRGGGHVRHRDRLVDMTRGHRRDGNGGGEHHRGRPVIVRMPAHRGVGDVGGEHHATARCVRVGVEQPQRLPRGLEHRHVLKLFFVTARVGLAQRRRDRERGQRGRAGLPPGQDARQARQRGGQVNAHEA